MSTSGVDDARAVNDRSWPRPVAFISLVLFGILIPVGAVFVAILANFSNAIPNNPEADVRVFQALIIGGMSGVLATAGGIFSAAGTRSKSVRRLAIVAAALGVLLAGGVVWGVIVFVGAHIT